MFNDSWRGSKPSMVLPTESKMPLPCSSDGGIDGSGEADASTALSPLVSSVEAPAGLDVVMVSGSAGALSSPSLDPGFVGPGETLVVEVVMAVSSDGISRQSPTLDRTAS